ncbi:hypothetical protein B0T18DRAFT_448469 [Schizothecium vesticola]|uniref:C2H2-type domain-containing protein n=1 Tax=Schizothecium vesticola TaxID=314040 RepID=A0AA40K2V1_9PEZI|nr:hypothetical protein B0T18DRAFT_448469 [Schizothecium vesticola]
MPYPNMSNGSAIYPNRGESQSGATAELLVAESQHVEVPIMNHLASNWAWNFGHNPCITVQSDSLHCNLWLGTHTCASCLTDFPTRAAVTLHAKQQGPGHSPFMCTCLRSFARLDTLKRHCQAKNGTAEAIHCPLCTKHDGDKSFTRRDHLQQHLAGYHKLDHKGLAHFAARNN